MSALTPLKVAERNRPSGIIGAGVRPSCHTKIASRTTPPAKVATVVASNNPVSGKAIKPKATPARPAKASSAPGQSMPRRRLGIDAFRQTAPGDPEGGEAEHRVDEEDRLPGQVIDDPAAQQRADGGGDGGEARPGADGAAAFALGKGGADQGQRTGNEQRRADALHRPRGDQLRGIAREAAAQRGQAEQGDAGDEDAAPAQPVAGGAAHQQEGREAERVGVDHPLQGGG